ncbi:MAG: FAD-dependent oxidoreductase, partial [Planctomycetota bacterium]
MIKKHSITKPWLISQTVIFSFYLCLSTTGCISQNNSDSVIWIEAEQFDNTGGWSNDSQFVDLMGSPYLLATGCGTPVEDAATIAKIPTAGTYRLWIRCKDWFPDNSPGQFKVKIDKKTSPVTFGKTANDSWQWIDGGTFVLNTGDIEIQLQDMAGWWGRCDAIVLAANTFKPANDLDTLAKQRLKFLGVTSQLKNMGKYDVVVVGGGLAGCGAAVSAARNGVNVALIQDRPVLGGNSSSEIQIPVMGHCFWRDFDDYDPGITGIIEEFYPEIGQTARSKEIHDIISKEKNLSLFLNTRATDVKMTTPANIKSVLALNVKTGQRLRFNAPLFIDCTGHGWIGYWAKAQYRQGQEPRSEFNESLAPVKAGKKTMGNDLYNVEFLTLDKPVQFECPQ